MIVKNWMQRDPITIGSEITASEAMRIFDEHKVAFLPVVDDGSLRGILTRRDIREAASCVTATQSIHEVNFFNTRLKVKDLMVRKPITLAVEDTVETALEKGRQFGRSFFPVVAQGRLVGTVSDMDLFNTLHQILGIDEHLCGITLENHQFQGDEIGDIVMALTEAGAQIRSIFTLKEPQSATIRLLVRFQADDPHKVVSSVTEKGYKIVEQVGIEAP